MLSSAETVGPPLIGKHIIAVIVSFNPQKKALLDLLAALLPQVDFAVLVDNHSATKISSFVEISFFNNLDIISMDENVGIAAAQNAGIERAMAFGADFVYLSDQDSVPSPSLIVELVAAIRCAQADTNALPIGAAGPATIDKRTGHMSFFVTEKRGAPTRWQPSLATELLPPFVEVAFLIASGTLIPMNVIKHVGAMRSSYFIDHVDTEWSFRARNSGYKLLGVPTSRLGHNLGDTVRAVWFFGSRQVSYHSPLRDYYMFRNTIRMLRDTPMTLRWKLHFLWRLVQFAGYFLVFSSRRLQRLQKMVLGLRHALAGVDGRLECDSRRCSAVAASRLEPANNVETNCPVHR